MINRYDGGLRWCKGHEFAPVKTSEKDSDSIYNENMMPKKVLAIYLGVWTFEFSSFVVYAPPVDRSQYQKQILEWHSYHTLTFRTHKN